jgi:nickel-type superoxide dismutase
MSGQRKALIIANDIYQQETLQNLLAPVADAEALARVLGDPQIGDFVVQVVRNEPAHVIQAQIEEVFSESRPDDVLLLHFSGHGLKSESGELFLAASNTRPNRLGSTAVSADFVQRCMRNSRSRNIVLLLDCCYGGAFAQGVKVRAAGDVNVLDSFPRERSRGRGRAVITASSAMEYAFEGDRLGDDQQRQPSVFTSALVEGLATGEADRDEDGWVSLDELYEYLFDKVREQNPHQTPSRQIEFEGDLYLARSRRRRIRPEPIPPDLQAALIDTNMYTRLGAVTELRSRLVSEDLPVASGAYQALAEIVRSGPRYVAEPAAEALSQVAVQPDQTELHFGRVEQDSPPPHRIVQLSGPPIAHVCELRPSHDWIRVNQMGERLDISIDTTRTGTLQGSLDLTGPTGVAVIAIDIDLVSTPSQHPAHKQAESQSGHEAGTQVSPVRLDDAQREHETETAAPQVNQVFPQVFNTHEVMIEAESVKSTMEKYQQNTDPEFRNRALIIKEQRSELVKHHLRILWTDYFKASHFEKYPQLHRLFNEAIKLAGAAGTKGSTDVAIADKLLAKIEEINRIFWETRQD